MILVLAACTSPSEDAPPSTPTRSVTVSPSVHPSAPDPVAGTLVAVGDIACAPGAPRTRIECHHAGTAELLGHGGPLAREDLLGVLLLGDIQYERGLREEYRSFDATWGRTLARLRAPVLPVAGNHEYGNEGARPPGCRLVAGHRHACGFLAYFSSRTDLLDDGDAQFAVRFGERTPHPLVVIALDVGRCDVAPAACAADGPVVRFLRASLADRATNPPEACTIVAWHQARWSEVGHGDLEFVDPVWRALLDTAGAQRPDLVLNGHDHVYERYPRLGRSGEADPNGIAQIVVGTGGKSIGGLPIVTPPFGGLAAIDASSFGVLSLRWSGERGRMRTAFVTETGDVRDAVEHRCRG
jgi:Calcineurin-like phosphoesterase